MASNATKYLESVQETLSRVLCLHNVPSVQPEHPEIEFPTSPEFSLSPLLLEKSPSECCYIEPTINSVRISLRLKQADELERWLTKRWVSLLTQAAYAEVFGILRRVPIRGYDLSFVVTARHTREFSKDSLIGFICSFIKQSASASQLKMTVSSRGRAIATDYIKALS